MRQFLGYMRCNNPGVVALMNDLYQNELYTLHNFFDASFKLTSKNESVRDLLRPMINYKTSSESLLETDTLLYYRIKSLKKYRDSINPFTLKIDRPQGQIDSIHGDSRADKRPTSSSKQVWKINRERVSKICSDMASLLSDLVSM